MSSWLRRLASAPSLSARARAILSVDVREELRRIDRPLRYLEARHDRKVPSGRALLRHRPDLDIRVIDAPHLVLKSRPEVAATALQDFISVIPG